MTKLETFLKKERILTKFKVNLKQQRIYQFEEICNSSRPISIAFLWHCTKEGHKYWKNISSKYEQLCA